MRALGRHQTNSFANVSRWISDVISSKKLNYFNYRSGGPRDGQMVMRGGVCGLQECRPGGLQCKTGQRRLSRFTFAGTRKKTSQTVSNIIRPVRKRQIIGGKKD